MRTGTSDEGVPPVLAGQPPIFILPTHLTLPQLHEIENLLVNNGGNLTYEIAEAGLVLGNVRHKKRAVLELRARGVWTQEVNDSAIRTSDRAGPGGETEKDLEGEHPNKRQRMEAKATCLKTSEIIDLSTESEDEEDGDKRPHNASLPIIRHEIPPRKLITILKLEWLNQSIAAGSILPATSFVVYNGEKITAPSKAIATESSTQVDPGDIIRRAKADDTSSTPKSPIKTSTSRHRPPLLRQTTSEDEEASSLSPQPDWVREQIIYACCRSTPLRSPNEPFLSNLMKIRQIRELTLDEIGVRAYSTSIAAVAAYPSKLRRPNEILGLPGCDHKIANLFAEFQQKEGKDVAAADALESDSTLRILNHFAQIWGVGAKTARDFYYHKGWKDLDDIVEYGWGSLSRVQQIGVKYYDEFQDPISRKEAESIVDIIQAHADKVRPEAVGGTQCILVGGHRRGKDLGGDVDLIISHPDDSVTRNLIIDVVKSLEADRYITHTLSLHLTTTHRDQQTLPYHTDESGQHFDTLDKALVVWQQPHIGNEGDPTDNAASHGKANPNLHRRVDIIISPWRTVGCAVLGWSGDTTFQRDLRRYAKKAHGWKFDSSGIRDRISGGQVVDLERDGSTWQEREKLVMVGLGIGWRPPNERCTR